MAPVGRRGHHQPAVPPRPPHPYPTGPQCRGDAAGPRKCPRRTTFPRVPLALELHFPEGLAACLPEGQVWGFLLQNALWLGCGVPGALPSYKSALHPFHFWSCVSVKTLQSCLTLCDPMVFSLPGSSIHGRTGKNTGLGCHFFSPVIKGKWSRSVVYDS